jgi:hypothetical protein
MTMERSVDEFANARSGRGELSLAALVSSLCLARVELHLGKMLAFEKRRARATRPLDGRSVVVVELAVHVPQACAVRPLGPPGRRADGAGRSSTTLMCRRPARSPGRLHDEAGRARTTCACRSSARPPARPRGAASRRAGTPPGHSAHRRAPGRARDREAGRPRACRLETKSGSSPALFGVGPIPRASGTCAR